VTNTEIQQLVKMSRSINNLCLLAFTVVSPGLARRAEDIVIADFEGADYGGWTVTGDAFGTKPAWNRNQIHLKAALINRKWFDRNGNF